MFLSLIIDLYKKKTEYLNFFWKLEKIIETANVETNAQ